MEKEIVNFDAVKLMREIRDKISHETEKMSYLELKEYIQKKLEGNKVLQDKTS